MSTSNTNSSCVKISIKQFGEFCRTCLTKISPPAAPVFIYGTVIDDSPLTEILHKCVNVKAMEDDRLPPNMCTQCVYNLGQFNSFYRQCQKSQQTLQSVLNLEKIIKKNTLPLKFHSYSKPVNEAVPDKTSSKLSTKPVVITKRTLQKVTKPELAPIQFIHSYCKSPADDKNVTNPPPLFTVKQKSGMDDTLAQIEQILIKTENLNSNSNVPPLLILTPEMKKTVFQQRKQTGFSEESSRTNTTSEETLEELVSFHLDTDNVLEPVPQQKDPAIITTPKKARKWLQTPRLIQELSKQPKIIRKRRSRLPYTPIDAANLNEQEKSKDPTPDNPPNSTPDDLAHPIPDDPANPTPDESKNPTPDDSKNPTPDDPPPAAEAEPKPPIRRQYQCEDCGLVFKGYHQYKTHTYSHTGGQMPHVCKHCGKDFLLNSLLKKHYYSHTNEKTVLCTYCSKFFKTPALLRLHIRKVHFKRPEDDLIDVKCAKCDMHFTSKNKYKMHQKQHSTLRHLCSDCGKIFKVKSHFVSHMRIHTGETPYKCSVCGKGFRNSFGLKHHVYSHTGEKPYECDVCQKKFRRPTHLKTHKKIHAKEHGSAFTCSFCGEIVLSVASWKKHLSTHKFQDEENSQFETVYC